MLYRCAGSDGAPCKDSRFQCQYQCQLKKTRTAGNHQWAVQQVGKWAFRPHSTNCLSRASLTTAEALYCSPVKSSATSSVSIQDSAIKVARDAGLPQHAVSKHVANRKRKEQNGTVEELYDINWGKLDTWGREFVKRNPGSHYHIETKGMRFERMFVGVVAPAQMALKAGINFSGVDGTFFRNSMFKNKLVMLQLTTRDGNNHIMPLAWCICKKENADNYRYFAKHCEEVKCRLLGMYLVCTYLSKVHSNISITCHRLNR